MGVYALLASHSDWHSNPVLIVRVGELTANAIKEKPITVRTEISTRLRHQIADVPTGRAIVRHPKRTIRQNSLELAAR